MIYSVPHLFALAHGQDCIGPQRCFFCGAPCDGEHGRADYVRHTFTGLDTVCCPGSESVCAGCVICLQESCNVPLPGGESRFVSKAAHRMFSWVVTPTSCMAASKSHLAWLRETCLEPPQPPFGIVLADSGQKQLLYAGVVSFDRRNPTITLEGERISYIPGSLRQRIRLMMHVAAATGKPVLGERLGVMGVANLMARYRAAETIYETYESVRTEPLSRLAAWLCPNKETCVHECPVDVA